MTEFGVIVSNPRGAPVFLPSLVALTRLALMYTEVRSFFIPSSVSRVGYTASTQLMALAIISRVTLRGSPIELHRSLADILVLSFQYEVFVVAWFDILLSLWNLLCTAVVNSLWIIPSVSVMNPWSSDSLSVCAFSPRSNLRKPLLA